MNSYNQSGLGNQTLAFKRRPKAKSAEGDRGGIAGLVVGGCTGNTAAIQPQPFFETVLAGTGYCNGFANCTQRSSGERGH
jgi:hypothetical protein